MIIAGLLPHIEVCGGVRRYFEMSNAFAKLGHKCVLFYKDLYVAKEPWMEFSGELLPYEDAYKNTFDIVYTGACECLDDIEKVSADVKVVLVVARFYTDKYLSIWNKHGRRYLWIGVGTGWAEQFPRNNIPEGRTCPGGVNINFFKPDAGKKSLQPRKVLFYMRSEGERRGLGVTLEGISQFLRSFPDCKWKFIGYDAYRSNNNKSIYVDVVLTDTQEKLRDLLQSGSIIVSSQIDGVWNNILAEGMACGLAAIGVNTASRDFLIDFYTGRIMRAGDPKSLADCLKWFYEDEKRIETCGENALNTIRELSWEHYAERFLDIVSTYRSRLVW